MRPSNKNKRRRGSAAMEFALVSVFTLPLLLGTFVLGMSLSRSIQVTQISRDAGHMYVRYVDFTQTSNQNIIVRLASGMGLTRTGGNGVVILSKIMHIGDSECASGGYPVGDNRCVNRNQDAFIQQLKIGDASARNSNFGTPTGVTIDANQAITDYLTNSGARATGVTSIITLNAGEIAFVSEAFFRTPELDIPGYKRGNSVYARTIF
jgi:hypothetical protein